MLHFNPQLNIKRIAKCCLSIVVAFTTTQASAQLLYQELYGTLFNNGFYLTEDVYARQFHDRSAATGNKMRLVHVADAFYNGGVWRNSSDSATLAYSGIRGWDTVLNEWAYDTLNNFIVNLPATREYGQDDRVTMNYYAFNQNLPQRRVFTYASNGKPMSYTHEELKGGAQWVAVAQYNYAYDAANRRVHQAIGDETTDYIYGPDNLDSIVVNKNVNGTWKFSNGIYYHYDTAKKWLNEVRHQLRYPNGSPYETGRTVYVRDAGGRVITTYRVTNKSLLVKDSIKVHYTYNDSGYIETIITQKVKDGVDSNLQRVEIAYNYLNQVISERQQYYSYSIQMWMYDKEKRYHYQTIWPVKVNELSSGRQPDVQLYPIPAKNYITVAVNDGGNGNGVITLMNINGALLRKWEYRNMGGNYTQQLSLDGLPSGNYVMRIETGNGAVTKQFVRE